MMFLQKCRVQVRFAPQLEEMDVRKEGVRMASKAMEAKAQKEYQESLQREKEKADEALVSILSVLCTFFKSCFFMYFII